MPSAPPTRGDATLKRDAGAFFNRLLSRYSFDLAQRVDCRDEMTGVGRFVRFERHEDPVHATGAPGGNLAW